MKEENAFDTSPMPNTNLLSYNDSIRQSLKTELRDSIPSNNVMAKSKMSNHKKSIKLKSQLDKETHNSTTQNSVHEDYKRPSSHIIKPNPILIGQKSGSDLFKEK